MITSQDTEPESVPSIYFTGTYGRPTARQWGARWITLVDSEGTWQMPLIITPRSSGAIDASTPYGYAGIFAADHLTDSELVLRWTATLAELARHNVTSLFLRFAPYDVVSVSRFTRLASLELQHVSDTIGIPVVDSKLMWTSLRGNARTAIRKAEKLGMTSEVTTPDLTLADANHPFRRLYESTMRRLDAEPRYFFGGEYYRDLASDPLQRLRVVTVRDRAGYAVASSLILADDSRVHYHLSGSDSLAARDGANNLLIWTVMQWALLNGRSFLHLGGGVSGEDGLFRFKESFGGLRLQFIVGRVVLDGDKYAELVRRRAEEVGLPQQQLMNSGYFPAYLSNGQR